MLMSFVCFLCVFVCSCWKTDVFVRVSRGRLGVGSPEVWPGG